MAGYIERKLERVSKLLTLNRASEAIALLEELVDEDPGESSRYLVLIGYAYKGQDDTNRALKYFRRAVSRNPRNVKALIGVAETCRDDLEERRILTRVLEIDPKNVDANYNVGVFRMDEMDLDGALVNFESVIEGYPNHPRAYHNTGMINEMRGRFLESLADFQVASLLEPEFQPSSEAVERLRKRLELSTENRTLLDTLTHEDVKDSGYRLAVLRAAMDYLSRNLDGKDKSSLVIDGRYAIALTLFRGPKDLVVIRAEGSISVLPPYITPHFIKYRELGDLFCDENVQGLTRRNGVLRVLPVNHYVRERLNAYTGETLEILDITKTRADSLETIDDLLAEPDEETEIKN